MYGFPVGFSSPESVLADQNDLFPVFIYEFQKTGNISIFPKSTYFTFIGTKKVM